MTDVVPPCLTAAKTYSVLLADPELSARAVLAAVIGAAPGLDVVGEAASGDETVTRAAETHPDVVVMGTGAPGMNLVTATRRLLDAADPPLSLIHI